METLHKPVDRRQSLSFAREGGDVWKLRGQVRATHFDVLVELVSSESLWKANVEQSLTVKPAVSLREGGQKELAVLLHGPQEVSLALQGQRLLHLTGTAGVVLGTEPQVLAWGREERARCKGTTQGQSFRGRIFD